MAVGTRCDQALHLNASQRCNIVKKFCLQSELLQLNGSEVRLSTGTGNRREAEEFETVARTRAWRQVRLGERPPYLLRSILNKCVRDWEVLDSAPKVPMYRPAVGEPRWLTRPEFARLVHELPDHLKAAARFAVLTGLRMRAMLSLTWQQVDLVKKRAWVSSSEMKAGHSLGIPLTAEAIQVLNALPGDGNYVFQWRGERVDDCNTLAFQKAVKAAKVEPHRWHDLRHTWASWAVQSGVSLHELMLLGGWRSFSMVLRYSHFAPHHLARAAAEIRLKLRTKTGTVKNPTENSIASH